MRKEKLYVAIMAGGIGSRFWPSSRSNKPKQFLDILGVGKSLIRLTFERFLKICPLENIYVVTNIIYKDLVLEHIPELKSSQILCEPSRNNTAPSVAYASFKINAINPNANMIIAPSDHIILNENEYIINIFKAVDFSEKHEALVTLGIKPTRPDTGYGYIHYGEHKENSIYKVMSFKEKPTLAKAEKYLLNGNYLWNGGIFIWNVHTILNSFKNLSPNIYKILSQGNLFYNTTNEQAFINDMYPQTENISVDYAILEKADNVYTIPVDIGWSDLGTWASLYTETKKDSDMNVIFGNKFSLENVQHCLIKAQTDKLIVVKDLNNFIIVDEPDVLIIYPISKEQDIKNTVTMIENEHSNKFS